MGFTVSLNKLEKKLSDGTRVRTHPRYRWRATFVESGKRKQKYFQTKQEADDFKSKREGEALLHGTDSSITSSERAAIVETRSDLDAIGLTLREAIALGIEARRRESKSCTVEEMTAMTISARENANRSRDYISEMKSKLGRFKSAFGDRPASSITASEVEAWLHGLKSLHAAGSVNSYRRILVVAFNDARRRGYIDDNPAEKVIQSRETESEATVLTPSEVVSLLEDADDEIVPSLVIGLFAGLRVAEIQLLDWSDVRLDHGVITVKAANAKSAKSRIVPIGMNLKAWLIPYAGQRGRVWPKGGRRLMEAARKNAGFGTTKEIAEAKKKGWRLERWPKNAIRHSYATYHLAHNRDAAELALHMGHDNTKLIFAHYRKPVTPEEAERFWSIEPEAECEVVDIEEAKAA